MGGINVTVRAWGLIKPFDVEQICITSKAKLEKPF